MLNRLRKLHMVICMMRIAKHNKYREAFMEKYDEFELYGEDIEGLKLQRLQEKNGILYERIDNGKQICVAKGPQKDEYGLYEYVDQRTGYCEDDYYGTVYRKTPIKGLWLVNSYNC